MPSTAVEPAAEPPHPIRAPRAFFVVRVPHHPRLFSDFRAIGRSNARSRQTRGTPVLEYLAGKRSLPLAAEDLCRRLDPFSQVLLDLGTGDGRFVRHAAAENPDMLAIGLDAC